MSQELFLQHLEAIQRVVDSVCRRQHFYGDKREEFASFVNLKLIDKDYSILRQYSGQTPINNYLTTVVIRLGLDFRNRELGKWRPSACARRLGPLAVQLETHLYRDGHTLSETLSLIAQSTGLKPDSLQVDALLSQLPSRSKRRFEDESQLQSVAAADPTPDRELIEDEKRKQWNRALNALSEALAQLRMEDRLMIKMSLDGLSWTRIASILGLERRLLYRRKDKVLRQLRQMMEDKGYNQATISSLFAEC